MTSTVKELRETFEQEDIPEDINVLYSEFEYEDYQGYCLVVFEQDGKLYEVNGSHCSCYGFEGQWNPEETTRELVEGRKLQWSNPHTVTLEQEYDLIAADLKYSNLYATLDCKSLCALIVSAGILLESNSIPESQVSRVNDAYLKALQAFANRKEECNE